MTTHYYTPKTDTAHHLQQIDYTYSGHKLTFITDTNVFSKDRVDFGSSLLIQTMEIDSSATVLDLGCGYGVIGICAALRAVDGKVMMVDINERAVELTKNNIKMNTVANAEALLSDGVEQLPEEEQFRVVLTNPPIRAGKDKVFQFYEGAYDRLLPNGSLWVVIQKKQGAESTEKKLKTLFADVQLIKQEKGYRIYKATKTM